MKHTDEQLKTQWAQVGDLAIRYRTNKDDPPTNAPAIVLIHGLVVSDRYLLPTACCLTPHYRVYVPDLPGYGKSDKPKHTLNIVELAEATNAWMQAIGLQHAIVLGNSLGCQIVAQLAVRHPERVQRAILTGPTMDPRARNAPHITARWIVNMPNEPLSLYFVILRDVIDIGIKRFIMTFRYGLQDRIELNLPHMHMPTLVVRGQRDTVAPERWTREMAGLLPVSKHVVIPGAGHAVNYNSPEKLASAVEAFLQDIAITGRDQVEILTNSSNKL